MSELSVGIREPLLVQIPEGWFSMGSLNGLDVEQPVHRVWVDAFRMAATQVTVEEYRYFLEESNTAPPPSWGALHLSQPLQPVVAVSWFAANAYCGWLSGRTGALYRLPTEAEWERAARGDMEGMPFPWGQDAPSNRPGYGGRWATGPEPVSQSEANGYGLFEMCENVHEWCQDWFDARYYAVAAERNPQGPATGTRKSSRGGSWRHHVKISRCAARSSIPPEFQYDDYGFRVVRDEGTAD